MKGLDTNILVRLLVADDGDQAERSARYIRRHCTTEDPGFINRIVLCELVWVLESAYGFGRTDIADVLDRLFDAGSLVIEDRDVARAALHLYRAGDADFADALIGRSNRVAGCEATATFDRKAARLDDFESV